MSIDQIDRCILNAVQNNNRLSSEELGEIVGLSATAVQRRLKRLREEGVIEADVSIVVPKAVGRLISMLVLVSLERERADVIDRFKKIIRATPEVMNAFHVIGEANFVLLVTTQTIEDYERFTRRFFHSNPDIMQFKAMVVLERVKVGFAIPIEAPKKP